MSVIRYSIDYKRHGGYIIPVVRKLIFTGIAGRDGLHTANNGSLHRNLDGDHLHQTRETAMKALDKLFNELRHASYGMSDDA